MAAHSAGSLEEVFDNPLIFQTPTAERHSLLIVGFDNFMGIVVKYYCFWRQYALNKTHQCMYCLFMTIRCKTLPAPMITFISSPPENQDQWKYCLLDKLRYFQVKVKVTFLWLEIVHYLKWIKQEIHCNSSSIPFPEVKVLTSEPGKGELERRSGWKAR